MLNIPTYTPHNWFWVVNGDTSRAWSSAASAYVTEYPFDTLTRIESEAALTDVLRPYGLAGPSPTQLIPTSVSPYQARVALTRAGLFDAVEAIMANESTPAEAKIAWEYAVVFDRHSTFIATLAPALGLTEQQIDELFVLAATI